MNFGLTADAKARTQFFGLDALETVHSHVLESSFILGKAELKNKFVSNDKYNIL